MQPYETFLVLAPADDRYQEVVPKVWGTEYWITNNDKYCAKILQLRPGFVSSLHYHPVKDETFHVLEGSCLLEMNGDTLPLARGSTARIRPGTRHRFWTSEPRGCLILEVSTPHDEKDVVRLEPSCPSSHER